MDEVPATGSGHARRNEDIALDLMKFVAMTTGDGRTTSTGVGFTGSGSAAKPEDYADKLLELYGRCLGSVAGKSEKPIPDLGRTHCRPDDVRPSE